MKKIQFKHLSLLNFCGIAQGEYDFGDNITIISARNGVGKTTILSAITYVLFGTDIKGNKLDPKTFDKDHNIIKEIPHEAELTISVDGEETILKRTLTDVWKGEEITNTYKYYVNGDVSTAGDFRKVVDSICPEITFRLCSSATDFTSRPWAEQRKFLETLVPSVTTDAITGGDAKYDFVVEALQRESIDKVVKHLKDKRKEVQKQLDQIPVRLTELNKALPEKQDWDTLEAEKSNLNAQLVSLDNKIMQIRTGGADKVRKDGIRSKIELAEKRKRFMERGASDAATDNATKHQSDVITANIAYNKAQSTVTELQSKMDGYRESEINAKDQKEECERKVKELNDKQTEIYSRQWQWNDKDSFCPHCLQPLPVDKLAQLKADSESNFKARNAEDLKKVQEDFGKLQQSYTDIKKLLEQIEEDRKTTTNQLVNAQKALKEAEKHKAEVDSDKPQTYEQILEEKVEYKQVLMELAQLNTELEAPTSEILSDGVQDTLKSLKEERTPIGLRYNEVLTLLAKKEEYDRISSLIENAQKEKATFQEQLDSLDEKIDVATDYYQLSCSILEDSINDKFKFVKWSLFQSDLEGNKKPFCECYHDGVPYSRLNGAAKVNAGIDIAYTIARYYDVSVPMLLDECESNLSPIYEGDQQIRLVVAPNEQMQFEYKDGD